MYDRNVIDEQRNESEKQQVAIKGQREYGCRSRGIGGGKSEDQPQYGCYSATACMREP